MAHSKHSTQPAVANPIGDIVPFKIDFSARRAGEDVPHFRQALDAADPADGERRAALLAVLAVAKSRIARDAIKAQVKDDDTTRLEPGTPSTPGQSPDASELSDPDSDTGSGPGNDTAQQSIAQAERIADQLDSPTARVYTLMARYAIDLSPESLPVRRRLAQEAIDLLATNACSSVRQTLLPTAYFMLLGALFESGDIHSLDAALSPELHLADQLADVLHSRYAIWFRCARASMDGQLTLAEQLAQQGYTLSTDAGDVDADAVWAGQIAIIRWMQGRVSEMEPVFLRARQADPAEPVWAAAVAWIWAHQGRARASRGLIESLPDVEEFPRSRNWLAAAVILAEVAAEVGSDELVERLRQALVPFADRVVPIGLGIASWGTVARPLALLAHRQERRADAIAYFQEAINLSSRIGAQAWLAQAQVELATLLHEAGDDSDASNLATESVSAARFLGLRAVEHKADRLLAALAHIPTSDTTNLTSYMLTPATIDQPPTDIHEPSTSLSSTTNSRGSRGEAASEGGFAHQVKPRITVMGEFSVTSSDGIAAAWKSRKARTLLKILLARRGAALARESAMELLWSDADPHELRNRFSVAMTTVRKALDPNRVHPADAFLVADSEVLRLRMDHLSVDVEDFFLLAQQARAALSDAPEGDHLERLLEQAMAAYTGDALAHEPYAAWAEQLRRQAHLAFFGVSHALATLADKQEDHLRRVELYRRILSADPYDQRAHDGLIDALTKLGATAHIAAATEEHHRRMAELGLSSPGTDA